MKSQQIDSNEQINPISHRLINKIEESKKCAAISVVGSLFFGIGIATSLYQSNSMNCDTQPSWNCFLMRGTYHVGLVGVNLLGFNAIFLLKQAWDASTQQAALLSNRVEHLQTKQS